MQAAVGALDGAGAAHPHERFGELWDVVADHEEVANAAPRATADNRVKQSVAWASGEKTLTTLRR